MRQAVRVALAALIGVCLFWSGMFLYFAYVDHRPWHSLVRGMTQEQVTAIMGMPVLELPTHRGTEWWYSDGIVLRFVDGVFDEATGEK